MKQALMVWGGWEGHEPEACVQRFLPVLTAAGYEVEVAHSLRVFADRNLMQCQDLVVPCWTMGSLSQEEEHGLLDAVRLGTGIAGWHGGMGDAFRDSTAYQFMVGGQFVEHPGGVIDYTVRITRPDDPIMAGLQDFSVNTELYYMHIDPSNEVLATAACTGAVYPWIDGVVMPVVWKRAYGAGRVFYSALGHQARDFDTPEAFEIMKRGMLWAAKA
jgi:type 1 glutamine amidotransferase